MPHIAGYMREALEEEKYGNEFNSKIGMVETDNSVLVLIDISYQYFHNVMKLYLLYMV